MNNKGLYFFGGVSATKQGHGGETIKNGILLNYLRESGFSVKVLDTVKGKKNKLRFMIAVIWSLVSPNKRRVVLSAATVSAVKYLRIASWFNIHRKEILYFVIGGTINTRIKNGEVDSKLLKASSKIFVEAHAMVEDLLEEEITNVERLPNFKTIPTISQKNRPNNPNEFKLVYVSRIMKEKGVLILIEAFKDLVTADAGLTLDFFGPIEKKFEEEFFEALSSCKGVQYKGIFDFANHIKAYEELSTYDVKVLPTFHYGEGFPGVFIDCFISGIPVITTKWNYNEEVIKHMENGLLINEASSREVRDAVMELLLNTNKQIELRQGALKSASLYAVDKLLAPIFNDDHIIE